MNIQQAINKLKSELTEAGITRAVNAELSIVFHQDSKGEVELECVHSKSRRAEHVHKVSLVVDPSVAPARKKVTAEDAKPMSPPAMPERRARTRTPKIEH